jgi:hypothetical protein
VIADKGQAVPLWQKIILDRCTLKPMQTGFLAALEQADIVSMALVAFFDRPNKRRFEALLNAPNGPAIASEIAWRSITGPADDGVLKVIHEVVGEHGSAMPLDASRAGTLANDIAASTIGDDSAGPKLRWLATQDRHRALVVALDLIASAPPGLVGPREVAAVRLLAEPGELAGQSAVLALARTNIEAGHVTEVDRLLEGLRPTAEVLPEIQALCSLFSATNRAPTSQLTMCLVDRCDAAFAIEVARTQPVDWAIQHLLPLLVQRHGATLLANLSHEGWTIAHRNWLVASAPWDEGEIMSLVKATQSFEPESPSLVDNALDRLHACVLASAGAPLTKGAYPFIGLRFLLTEVLDGRLAPDDPRLRLLSGFDSAGRIGIYSSVNWRSAQRAERFASASGFICAADVVSLFDSVKELSKPARGGFFLGLAPHLDDAIAARVVDTFSRDAVALDSIARSEAGAKAVLSMWNQHGGIELFTALARTAHAVERLEAIPRLVRDYANGFSEPDRESVLREFVDVHDGSDQLLVDVVDDWDATPSVPVPLLECALTYLIDRPLEPELSHRLLADTRALCENHTNDSVRTLAYTLLPDWEADEATVELLARRRVTETMTPSAVTDACGRIALDLADLISKRDGEDRREALGLLATIEPAAALPFARNLATLAPLPEDRKLGISIIGSSGGGDSDVRVLEDLSKSHPNHLVRQAATRELRRIAVGDLAGAHVRLGHLAGRNPALWDHLDPKVLYGHWGEMLRAGLDRIARDESGGSHGSAIDQLGAEVAKVVLYRLLEVAGNTVSNLKTNVVASAVNHTGDYGVIVRNVQIQHAWPSVTSLIALYEMRTEHLAPKGTTTPFDDPGPEDWTVAKSLFRRGVGPLLDRLVQHV